MKETKPTHRRIANFDLDTGEVLPYNSVIMRERKVRNGFGHRWFSMSQEYSTFLAKNGREIGRDGFMVLHYLMGGMEYQNDIMITQAEIGQQLGMMKQAVSRAMKKLVSLGILEEGKKFGNAKRYRLSASVGWKGKALMHNAVLANGFDAVTKEDK